MALRKRETLQSLFGRLRSEIAVTARGQRVPGLTVSEVEAEMWECLWRAHETFNKKSGLTVEQYWWAIWQNRKINLIAYHFRQKRDRSREVLTDPVVLMDSETMMALHPLVTIDDVLIPLSEDEDPMAVHVWRLLATGSTRMDVLDICEISKRRFYTIVDTWRTDNMKEYLSP